jgi:hypothetical protein
MEQEKPRDADGLTYVLQVAYRRRDANELERLTELETHEPTHMSARRLTRGAQWKNFERF